MGRAVAIFDWDGVVVDSSDAHEQAWARLAAAEGEGEAVSAGPERILMQGLEPGAVLVDHECADPEIGRGISGHVEVGASQTNGGGSDGGAGGGSTDDDGSAGPTTPPSTHQEADQQALTFRC